MRRMNVAAIVAVMAFSVLVPSVSAQAADTPSELCPTLPPNQTTIPDGPVVENALVQTAIFNEEPECAPGSMEFEIPMDILIELLEASGYDVIEHGVVDAVIFENDAMAYQLRVNQSVTFVLLLVIIGMGVLWYRDHQRTPKFLK